MIKIKNYISSIFSFKERGATFKKEIIGGLSTFLAMAYILAVNPGMLSQASMDGVKPGNEYAGVFFLGTAISAFIGTMAMGMFAKIPVALAPAMGVNAFFAYTVASSVLGLTLPQALVATFFSGILYSIIAITPARHYISKILPKNMKLSIGAMTGLFLAYVGLSDSGIIISGANPYGPTKSGGAGTGGVSTLTKLGNFSDPFVLIALVILILVFVLHFMKVNGAAIIAILIGVILLAILKASGVTDANQAFKVQSYNDFGKFQDLSTKMWSSFGSSFSNGKFYIAVFVFLYIDFFDTTGTLFTIGEQADLNKDKKSTDKWLKKANMVDAGSTIFGSIMLTSTTTSYTESTVGVSQGARTGFSSVIAGLGFGISILIWPILTPILPIKHIQNDVYAQSGYIMPVTGPILVLVGSLMISQLKHFEWEQLIDIPVLFITLIFGLLGFSISTGIAAGVIVYYCINASALVVSYYKHNFSTIDESIKMSDKVRKINNKNPNYKKRIFNPTMFILFILAVTYFATMPLYFS